MTELFQESGNDIPIFKDTEIQHTSTKNKLFL